MSPVNKTLKLNNGIQMPVVGLGLWRSADAVQNVQWAIEAGYRLIDTASIYGNEKEAGIGVKNSGINRKDIFITTKVWPDEQGYKQTLEAIDKSLERLKLDYVDLYLIHWPVKSKSQREETWKAMEEINKSGKAKAIGVSNYTIELLEEMKNYANVPPAVNQIEFHPFWFRKELMDYCHTNSIAVEDYCPLARAKKLQNKRLMAIAKGYGKTEAQVVLRWALQLGNIVIPKSSHKERIKENIAVFDFELTEADMINTSALNENYNLVSS